MPLTASSIPIISTIYYLSSKNNKNYCFPSQEKLKALIKEKYYIDRSRRTLNYNLRRLEDEKFIKRTRRIKKSPAGKLLFDSTLYRLCRKAWKLLYRLGIAPITTIKTLIKPVKKEELPKTLEEDKTELMERRKVGLKYIREIIEILSK
jgi:hypothetical protein